MRVGMVVGDAPKDIVTELRRDIIWLNCLAEEADISFEPVICAVNRAGCKLLDAGFSLDCWASWHYPKLIEWSVRHKYEGPLISDNSTLDPRIRVCPVPYTSGSSTFTAAQMLLLHFQCRRVVVVNTLFNGLYEHFLRAWREKSSRLQWCKAYTGPLKNILGEPTVPWLIDGLFQPLSLKGS